MHYKKGMELAIQSALNLQALFLVTFCRVRPSFQIDLIVITLG